MAQAQLSKSTAQPEWMLHINALRKVLLERGDSVAAKDLDRVEQALTSPLPVIVVEEVPNNTRHLIRRLIGAHEMRRPGKRPPFTIGELIVMAALWNSDTYPSLEQVISWIASKFSYFGGIIHSDWFSLSVTCGIDNVRQVLPSKDDSRRREYQGRACEHPTQQQTMQSALLEYDFPIINQALRTWSTRVDHSACIQVPSGAGRIYLRHLLEKPHRGAFRFMDLPSELRASIYEMVLSFPRTGLRLILSEWRGGHTQLRSANRMLDPDVPDPGQSVYSWSFRVAPMCTLLALLSVDKAINHEALPYFYRINRFDLEDAEDVSFFLRRMGPERRCELRELSFSMETATHGLIIRVLNLLAKCTRLRKLDIIVGDMFEDIKDSVLIEGTRSNRYLSLLAELMQPTITLKWDSTTRLTEVMRFIDTKRVEIKARLAAPPAHKRRAPYKAFKSADIVLDSDDEAERKA